LSASSSPPAAVPAKRSLAPIAKTFALGTLVCLLGGIALEVAWEVDKARDTSYELFALLIGLVGFFLAVPGVFIGLIGLLHGNPHVRRWGVLAFLTCGAYLLLTLWVLQS
jgi:hypothetical protein